MVSLVPVKLSDGRLRAKVGEILSGMGVLYSTDIGAIHVPKDYEKTTRMIAGGLSLAHEAEKEFGKPEYLK